MTKEKYEFLKELLLEDMATHQYWAPEEVLELLEELYNEKGSDE